MPRSDRLFRLLHVLRSLPPPVTAARLAAETDVSERSIYRDIGALRAAGARIDGEAGYGYALTEDPALPPQSFTRIEIEALLLGLAEVRNSGDAQLSEAAEAVLAKITARLPERQQREAAHAVQYVYRHDRRDVPQHDLRLIREACWEERALDLQYRDENGRISERRILPLTIAFLEVRLIVLGWCCLRQDYRKFRIDRISSVVMADESFRPRRVGLLRDYVRRMVAEKATASALKHPPTTP
jgi:predicted DNA-binding transcriptional regulator YafY